MMANRIIRVLIFVTFGISICCGGHTEISDKPLCVGSDSEGGPSAVAKAVSRPNYSSDLKFKLETRFSKQLQELKSETVINDDCDLSVSPGGQQLLCIRRFGEVHQTGLLNEFRKLIGSSEAKAGETTSGLRFSIKSSGKGYTIEVVDGETITSESYENVSRAIDALEPKVGHRLLIARLLMEGKLLYSPSEASICVIGIQPCQPGIQQSCYVGQWTTDYFGDHLIYRAWTGVADGKLRKLEETFYLNDVDRTVLVEEFKAF